MNMKGPGGESASRANRCDIEEDEFDDHFADKDL
jgi:hypothetical protein